MDQMNAAVSTLPLSKPSNCSSKIPLPEAPSIKQSFSIPDSVIYYMAKNPSPPEVYLKLAKSCKYFFEKFPLLIAACIHGNAEKICSRKYSRECERENGKCCINVNIKNIRSKIWLTDELRLSGNDISNVVSVILPKLYRCENAHLILYRREITMKDFKILAAYFEKIFICCFEITDVNGSNAMLESILETVSGVVKLLAKKDYNYRGT